MLSQLSNLFHCKNILKITIIWHNELFNGKGQKKKHIIFVDLFHSNADKNVIYNFSLLPVIEMNSQTISGVEQFLGQAQAQGFLNFFNPSPVSDLPSPNL